MLYNVEGELAADAGAVDIERAAIRRRGRDVTLIAYGGTLGKALEAAATLAKEGIDAEVIDLRTLRPLDDATILASVARTRRAVIVDEGWRIGQPRRRRSARASPRARSTSSTRRSRASARAEVPIPYARHLEQAALPQAATVVDVVRRMVSGHG